MRKAGRRLRQRRQQKGRRLKYRINRRQAEKCHRAYRILSLSLPPSPLPPSLPLKLSPLWKKASRENTAYSKLSTQSRGEPGTALGLARLFFRTRNETRRDALLTERERGRDRLLFDKTVLLEASFVSDRIILWKAAEA